MCAANSESLPHASTTPNVYAVILAGGVGTRLWPSSRRSHPKQFSDITGDGKTMIQTTVDRIDGLIAKDHILVATGKDYGGLCQEQLPFLKSGQIILEPSGRNTAPAVALSVFRIYRRAPDAVVALMHSDHAIPDENAFHTALQCAIRAAEMGNIVTLGIQPTSAHTGYGYIERGEVLYPPNDACPLPIYAVSQFLEKPNLALAEIFLTGGRHYWNGGIFVVRADRLVDEFRRQLTELSETITGITELLDKGLTDEDSQSQIESLWESVEAISFDDGIMEGASNVAVVPLDAGWNDVGSWNALEEVLPFKDGNLIVHGDVVKVSSDGNIVYSDKTVALIDVHDMVIVDTGDALLVGHKTKMQHVRDIVEELKARGDQSLL